MKKKTVMMVTLAVLSFLLIGCAKTEESSAKKNKIEPTIPKVTTQQDVGADMVMLDFASDDKIIFHGYFGLFVYDLNTEKITQSFDLEPINCNFTQGDNTCVVTVNKDGREVNLHPISSENMYVYKLDDNTLEKKVYIEMSDPFKMSEAPRDIDEKNYSYVSGSVKFSDGDIGYLAGYDMTLGSLRYVRGDKEYVIFK